MTQQVNMTANFALPVYLILILLLFCSLLC